VVHIVTYDLKSPNDTSEDYARVITGLKSTYKTWCHLEKSAWLVATDNNAQEVRDSLKRFLSAADILFVAKLTGNWGSFNLGSRRSDWIKGKEF
jgi:hypothetical protein